MDLDKQLVKTAREFRRANTFLPAHRNVESHILPNFLPNRGIIPLYVQNDYHAKGAYTCAHLETDGVHMKTPPWYNFIMVYSAQAALENRFNEGFLKIFVSPAASIANERKTYAFLESQGFNTLRLAPEQHLINGIPVLMTKRIEAKNLAELIENKELSPREISESYAKAGCQMRQKHDLGVYWGDPKPGNMLDHDGTFLSFDFGPIVNRHELPDARLRAKDIQIFFYEMMIARGQIHTENAMYAVLDGYQPTTEVRREVSRSITRQKKYLTSFGWQGMFKELYLKQFHKCTPEEFLDIEKIGQKLAA